MSSSATNPYSIDRPADKLFCGRQSELDELSDGLCSPTGCSYALIGGRRFGKTSILKQLQRLLSRPPAESWSIPIIPVYFNLLGYTNALESLEGFFSAIQALLGRQIASCQPNLLDDCTLPLAFQSRLPPYCVFGDWLVQRCTTHKAGIAAPKVVLLLDEIERVLHKSWKNDLLSSLRMLVYEDDSYSRVFGLVTAGSSEFFQEIEDYGSPLWQVLNPVYLLALSEEEATQLIQEPSKDRVPESVAKEIMFLSGGHPYLIQYFMQNLWGRLPEMSVGDVESLARNFKVTKAALLSSWQQALGPEGAQVYKILAENHNTWISEQQIRAQIRRPNIMASAKPLCYHGFAVPRDHDWTHFRCTGELFRTWFIQDSTPTVNVSGDTEGRHQETQRQELDRRYKKLSERIAALDTDLGVETDSERKLSLKERREQVIAEREEVTSKLREIEPQLADTSPIPGT